MSDAALTSIIYMMHSLIYSTVNWLIWSYVIAIQVAKCTGSGCTTLAGTWYNELGSMMNVTHAENGELTGTYVTAVERDKGYLTTNHSQIFGTSPYSKPGSVFGFSVMWKGGLSMTSWTGQCFVCADGGEEVLETSWLLKIKVSGCLDSWKSTMIGQDTFKRYDFARTSNQPKRVKRQSPEPEANNGTEVTSVDDARPCKSLSGYWYNQVGSEMHITTHYDNQVRGEYRITRQQCNGVSGSTHSNVYGGSNNTDTFSTVFLFVVWNNGEAITGWVGQCHVCGENNTETLILTWLLRSQIDSCHDNTLSTNYGEARFTRKPQISGGHKPGEFGEKSETIVCGSASRIVHQPIVTLLVCLSSIRIFMH